MSRIRISAVAASLVWLVAAQTPSESATLDVTITTDITSDEVTSIAASTPSTEPPSSADESSISTTSTTAISTSLPLLFGNSSSFSESATESSSVAVAPTTLSTLISSAGSGVASSPVSASAAAPSATGLSCPLSNNTQYTAPSGARFLIECYIDHFGGDLAMEPADSFQQCIDICDRRAGCVDISFQGSACYMKASVGRAIYSETVLGALLLSPPTTAAAVPVCPASNGLNYTTSSEKTFVIECGVDYTSGRNEDNLAVISVDRGRGGDEIWLQRCVETCGNTTSCVDVSLSGSACYLKSSISEATRINNANVVGARLIDPVPSSPPRPSTPTAAPAPAPPQATSTAVGCPQSNGTTYYANNSGTQKAFVIECGIDYASTADDLIGGPNNLPGTSGELWLSQCIELCANTTDCVDISLSGAACYMKSHINGRDTFQQEPEFGGARLLAPVTTPPVPASNTSVATSATSDADCSINSTPQRPACNNRALYVEDAEQIYRVQCGVEYIGGDLGEALGGFTGLRAYRNCVETCAYTEGCVAVAFSETTCQLKDAVSANRRTDSAVWGAINYSEL